LAVDNRILEIVFYLMDYLHESHGQMAGLGDLSMDLKGLGYSDEEITRAYSWVLDHVQSSGEQLYASLPEAGGSTRVLTPSERSMFTPDAYSFLLRLSVLEVVRLGEFEEIIERIAMFGQQPVSVEQLKMIVAVVVFGDHSEAEGLALLGDKLDPSIDVN
jgi:uncharacterized protein Smg (DUF494 family)